MKDTSSKINEQSKQEAEPKRLNVFERYLTIWVLLCMVVGVALGKFLPGIIASLSAMEFGEGSQ
ncbi:MAG: hypothetical protein QMD11_13235, partial [Smithella sp.]|nr:hypothetical protein [Smithella sp.]